MKTLDLSKISTAQVVTIALQRNRDLHAATAARAEVDAELLKRGVGPQVGVNPDEGVTVVAPGSAGVKYPPLSEEDAVPVRKLLGDDFWKLYTRFSGFTPAKSFADVSAALLTPAKLKKLLDVASEPTKGKAGYVLYPKA